jgi:gamma-glutamyltranspeptidase/glutathione hydrolase
MESGQRIEDRDTTAMLPTILRAPDGALMALGAAGSDMIPGAVIRAIVNLVDLGMSPQRAAAEPACVIHDGCVQVSRELDASVPARLAQMGIPIRLVGRNEGEHFGLLHIAGRSADGRFVAGADTYWDGGTARA